MKNNYEKFDPPFYWKPFNCYVLDSWYDEEGTRHHTCTGPDVMEGDVYHSAIIHKGEKNV